jgi:hypothetical protein
MPTILSKEEMRDKALDIAYTDGAIFSVTFVKRTTGELRKMVARRGVKKYLAGGELGYVARDKALLPVFDMQKSEYRCISCDAIQEVVFHGEIYRIPDAKLVE